MATGRLDRRITIEQVTQTRGTTGSVKDSWASVHRCWAEKEYGIRKGEGETYDAARLTADNTVKFRIRYYAGITEKMRINDDSVYYDIEHIAEEGRKRFLIIKAKKRD